MVRLKAHRSALLQDGLVGCMQPLADSWGGVVIVVMVTRWRVVVVVHGLVSIIVLLLSEEVGVEISAGMRRWVEFQPFPLRSVSLAYSKYPALTVQARTRPLSHWRVCPCSNRAGSTTWSNKSSRDSSLTGASLRQKNHTQSGENRLLTVFNFPKTNVRLPVEHHIIREESGQQ